MKFSRRYTTSGQDPYENIAFRTAVSEIKNPDGSIVFQLKDIEVPAHWSQVASDIIAQKYFRKAGVPSKLKAVEENSVPSWLWRHVADEKALAKKPESERSGSEKKCKTGFRSSRRHMDILGMERWIFFHRRGCADIFR